MREVSALTAAWMEEVRVAGVPLGKVRKVSFAKLRGRLFQTWKAYDNSYFEIELADIFEEEESPERAMRAAFCWALVYTCPDCWDNGGLRASWLRQIEDTYGWDLFRWQTRFDLRHPKKKPLLTLHCPHCGLRWEVREKRKADRLLEDDVKYCPLCPSLMVPEGQEDAVVERDLPALAEECRRELRSIGIPLGEVSSVRFAALGRFYGQCSGHTAFTIEIDSLYQDRRVRTDDLKEVLYHELLHTCPDDDNHGKQWRSYAWRVDELLNSTVMANKTDYDLLHPDAPVLGRAICPGCGQYHNVRDPSDWEFYTRGGKRICYCCGTSYGLKKGTA